MSITHTVRPSRWLYYDPANFSGAHASRLDCEHPERGNYRFLKKIGSGDNGEVYLALWRPDIASVINTNYDAGSLYRRLREKLVVVKVALDHRLENDLTVEYIVLAQLLTKPNRAYTATVAGCLDGPVQWLVTKYFQGGALGSSGASVGGFKIKHEEAFTLSFRWHIGAAMAANMLYVLYGITDMFQSRRAAGHPLITHGDLFHCNTLLDASGCGSESNWSGSRLGLDGIRDYKDFPDLVIADFGRAKQYISDEDYSYFLGIVFDIRTLGDDLAKLPKEYGPAEEFNGELELMQWIDRLNSFGQQENIDPQSGIAILQQFARVAKDRREMYYRGMPAAALATLQKEVVSDAELDDCVLECLASQQWRTL